MATLEELRQKKKENGLNENPETLKKLSTQDLKKIIPQKEKANPIDNLISSELSLIDQAMQKEKAEIVEKKDEYYTKNEEELDSAIFDAPVEDMDSGLMSQEEINKELQTAFKNAAVSVKEDPNIKAGVEAVSKAATADPENMDIDDLLKELNEDDSFDDEDDDVDISEFENDSDEDDDEEEQKKMLKDMQDQIGSVIKPFQNVVDLKSFTIATKPKSVAKVLEQADEEPTANWVLLDSKRSFACTALRAVEIENLDPNKTNAQNGRIDALKQMYGTLYKHYVSPNKPKTLEEWVKTISYSDQDNLIFGYYKATFGNSNFITYACEKCKEVKVENVPIENCIKYSDDETKHEVEEILRFGDPTHKNEITAKLVQISDRLAVSIKNPSIYNIVFEFGVLDSAFTNKFADTLGVVGFIENFYEIDLENNQLIPITIKEDPKNITKSVKRRIRAKVEMLKTLKPDQYQILTSEIANISKNSERISYCQPEYTCQKCTHKIEEVEMPAQQMLFMRHQLALIKTLSIE